VNSFTDPGYQLRFQDRLEEVHHGFGEWRNVDEMDLFDSHVEAFLKKR
jgi:hypothetical protein